MRIVHATSVHPADDHRIAHKECRSLAQAGHDVTIVALRGSDPALEGVRSLILPEETGRFSRILRGAARVIKTCRDLDADVVHLHDPELLLYSNRLRRRPIVIFDMHEDIPAQIQSKEWIPALLRGAVSVTSKIVLPRLLLRIDGLVIAEPEIDAPAGIPHVVVQNLPVLDEFSDSLALSASSLRLVYLGGVSRARGALDMLDMIVRLREVTAARLTIAGPIQDVGLGDQMKRHPGWRFVDYHPWLDRQEVVRQLADSHIGLVLLHPEPNYVDAYPVKMFEYMAAGCAVVASDFPLWRRILSTAKCGVVVPPGAPNKASAAILDLWSDPVRLAEMQKNGRAAVESQYNWEAQAARLNSFYGYLYSGKALR